MESVVMLQSIFGWTTIKFVDVEKMLVFVPGLFRIPTCSQIIEAMRRSFKILKYRI